MDMPYTFDLKIIDISKIEKKISITSIKYIYPLKDEYFIIVQQNKFSLVCLNDSSFSFCYNIILAII